MTDYCRVESHVRSAAASVICTVVSAIVVDISIGLTYGFLFVPNCMLTAIDIYFRPVFEETEMKKTLPLKRFKVIAV